jgi:hypothetical protein
MNLDRIIPKSIRENGTPVETMLDELETFANAIGGPAWRQRRARMTGIERTVTLYLDEEYETLDSERQILHNQEDGEEIEIAFSAHRVAPDPEDDDMTDFSNVYNISHSTSLPLSKLADMPDEYRQQLVEELMLDDDSSTDTSVEPDMSGVAAITETNTIEYTIYQVDGSISYNQTVEYDCGEINIPGATYTSEIEVTAVHHPNQDDHSEEWLTSTLAINEDSVENVGERILIMDDLEKIIGDTRSKIELLSQTSEDHAIRVLALLSLVSNGIRIHRLKDDE